MAGPSVADLNSLFEMTKAAAETVESFATIAAMVIGGIWTYNRFIARREEKPRAKIEHKTVVKKLDSGENAVFYTVEITNLGDVVLPLEYLQIRFRQMLPLPEDASLEPKRSIVNGNNPKWPVVAEHIYTWDKDRAFIEPKESNISAGELIVPAAVQVGQLFTYLRNSSGVSPNEVGWQQAHPGRSSRQAGAKSADRPGGSAAPGGRSMKSQQEPPPEAQSSPQPPPPQEPPGN